MAFISDDGAKKWTKYFDTNGTHFMFTPDTDKEYEEMLTNILKTHIPFAQIDLFPKTIVITIDYKAGY